MADPTVTDVFKFVAVRPPQPAPEGSGGINLVHDPRAKTADGKAELSRLARGAARPGQALALYRKLDLTRLDRLAAGYRTLVHAYITGPADGAKPKPEAALQQAGLADEDAGSALAELAWNALYLGYLAEPADAPLLDKPTAALRALHFARHAGQGGSAKPAPADLLEATPVIPEEVRAPFDPSPEPRPAIAGRAGSGEEEADPRELARMRALIGGVDAAHRLLDTIRLARPRVEAKLDPPPSEPVAGEGEEAASRSFVSLTTVPTVADLPGELPAEDRALLATLGIEGATLPAATQALESHAANLTQQAYRLRGNRRFVDLVKGSASRLGTFLVPIPLPAPGDPSTAADVDVRGRIRPLGIGDLKVVKQKLLAYLPGEIAHIENVLKGESKERVFRTLDRTETTVFSSEELTEETTRDTQTTDRFELKREAEQTIKEDMSIKAGLTVSGGLGPVTITAHGEFAYSTAKQESLKSSANFAREVVDRSVTKVQKKTTTERTTKTLRETEETDTHGIDNKKGSGHVSGIYRWVDKKYRAQVYNYGRRLMLEFVVPDPAAFFRAAQKQPERAPTDAKPPAPFLDLEGGELTAADIDPFNYTVLASRYNAAGVTPPPPEWTTFATNLDEKDIPNGHTFAKSSKEITVPAGYRLASFRAVGSFIWQFHPHFAVQVGAEKEYIEQNEFVRHGRDFLWGKPNDPQDESDDSRGIVPVSAMGYDIQAYTLHVEVLCKREKSAFELWQLQTFDKIYTAYKALQTEYDQKVKQAEAEPAGIPIMGRNPGLNREIEKKELKKLCLELLTGQHFGSFDAMTDPSDPPAHLPEVDVLEALDEGPVIQFFEQAFDWEQLTYVFYPYFWSRKKNWVSNSRESDPDPLFAEFLQAGAARVVIPASPAYQQAVVYYLGSDKPNLRERIWNGGPTPTLSDLLYKSIADEIRNQTDDLAGAKPEGEPWEFTMPTTLVWLQEDSKLPTFQ